ncbi:MAG: hypothetical protein V1655_03910 [bacterium]
MTFILLLLVLNILFFKSSFLGIILGGFYLLNYGKKLGKWIFPKEDSIYQTLFGIFFILIFLSSFGAVIYYFYKLNSIVVLLILLSIPCLIKKLYKKYPLKICPDVYKKSYFWETTFIKTVQNFLLYAFNKKEFRKKIFTKIKNFLLSAKTLYLIIFLVLLKTSFSYSTSQAVRSPWLVLPRWHIFLYFISTALLISIILKEKSSKPLLFIILHTFLTSSLALIIYKLGYGFDPFIHQATEKIIFEKGFILPKPLYYLGQYSLVVILSHIFQKSTAIIDKFLVPLMYSIYIPIFAYFSLSKFLKDHNKYIFLSLLSILILPCASFIATTPQALANILAIVIVFLSLLYIIVETGFKPVSTVKHLMFFLAVATILIHPLTGLCVFIFLLILFTVNKKFKFKKIILPIIIIISSVIIPFIFSLSSTLKTKINFDSFTIFSLPLFNTARQYNLIKDFVYLYGGNITFIFLIISILGIIIFHYHKNNTYADSSNIIEGDADTVQSAIIFPYLLTFLILVANYIILKIFISFNALIYYEQNNYAERLFTLSLYFLLPFFIIAFYYFFKKLGSFKEKTYIKIFFFSLFALWITSSFYLTYPRYDNYSADRGYNVSEADFHAVEFINKNENENNYIVLANQNTSAAALSEYGFLKYFALRSFSEGGFISDSEKRLEQIFYYPIPTSSPLYDYYLEMVNIKPTREVMKKAMDLAGVKTGYFVICDYWWKSDQIIEKAKLEADEYYSIKGGKSYVFRYTL